MSQRVLLITGASRGIGAETARRAVKRGYAVCVNYRHNDKAAKLLLQELNAGAQQAIAVKANVGIDREVRRLFAEIDGRLGNITALVNNAAILEQQCDLEDITIERLRRVFETNVYGSFLCAREAIKRMSTKHGGHGGAIVNVSSRAAVLGSAHEYIDYAASKGAIDTMTTGLANELGPQKIRVNAVRPGLIDTEMHASGGEPGRVDRLKNSIPLQRGGDAGEVADAILWLLSAEASYINGSFVDVSGGR